MIDGTKPFAKVCEDMDEFVRHYTDERDAQEQRRRLLEVVCSQVEASLFYMGLVKATNSESTYEGERMFTTPWNLKGTDIEVTVGCVHKDGTSGWTRLRLYFDIDGHNESVVMYDPLDPDTTGNPESFCVDVLKTLRASYADYLMRVVDETEETK